MPSPRPAPHPTAPLPLSPSPAQPQDRSRPNTRPTNRAGFNRGMKLVRRLHLTFGLVLTPFVLLYGLTALLFNHPTWLSDRTTEPYALPADAPALPPPDELAAAVIAALQAHSPHGPNLRPLPGHAPAYVGSLSLESTDDRTGRATPSSSSTPSTRRYTLDPLTARGTLTTRPLRPRPSAPFPSSIDPPAAGRIDAIARAVGGVDAATEHGDRPARVRSAPALELALGVSSPSGDEQPWALRINTHTGDIDARPLGHPARPMTPREFITRLHTTHVYPDRLNARWLWSALVDAMGVLMIFWGLSGVAMGWQLKNLRRLFTLSTLAGLALAALLGWSMLALLSAG